jgi:poly-gamma-glutamate capsule biosynthesis protein CapA/YwtB (metallophosphatase superfamily)
MTAILLPATAVPIFVSGMAIAALTLESRDVGTQHVPMPCAPQIPPVVKAMAQAGIAFALLGQSSTAAVKILLSPPAQGTAPVLLGHMRRMKIAELKLARKMRSV